MPIENRIIQNLVRMPWMASPYLMYRNERQLFLRGKAQKLKPNSHWEFLSPSLRSFQSLQAGGSCVLDRRGAQLTLTCIL